MFGRSKGLPAIHPMRAFNNLGIGVRLAAGFTLTLVMAVLIAATGSWRLEQVLSLIHI